MLYYGIIKLLKNYYKLYLSGKWNMIIEYGYFAKNLQNSQFTQW